MFRIFPYVGPWFEDLDEDELVIHSFQVLPYSGTWLDDLSTRGQDLDPFDGRDNAVGGTGGEVCGFEPGLPPQPVVPSRIKDLGLSGQGETCGEGPGSQFSTNPSRAEQLGLSGSGTNNG